MCVGEGHITGPAATKVVTAIINHGFHLATETELTFSLKRENLFIYYKMIPIIDNLENTENEKNGFWWYHNSNNI